MRDAKEIWHFPDPANDDVVIRSRLTKPNTYRRTRDMQHRFQTFLCNAAESFGKERETVCVSGSPGTTATNPEQEKEIKL
jgi:hypothetical protein